MVVEMSGFMKQTRDSLLNLSGAFKQLNEGFNSVCAQFNNKKLLTESPKRKKTSLAAVNTVTVSTPNPNLVAAAVSVDTVVSEPTAPMDTAVLGEVTASRSRVVKKPSVPATVPTVPIGTEVTVSGSQLSEVQSAAGGRKKLSVVPHRKQLFVSRFTPDTTSEDVLEFIREKFPSENISVEQFRFSYARSISSFKIFAPPNVFKVLLSESFWLNDDLVIKGFVPNKPRTSNRPSTAPKN